MTVSDLASNVDFLEPLLPHTSKIGCLRLTKHRFIEGMTDDLPGFFDSPMPNLTSLELHQVAEPSVNLFPPSGTPVPPVFQNLKTLRLTRAPLYPTLFSIASLKELKLLGYESPLNFGTFIGFLRLNRDLEHVVLDVRFVADSAETEFSRKVSLPRLQNLTITCYKTIDSKGLLSCISFPHSAHIEVISIGLDPATPLSSFLPSPPTPIQDLLAPITTITTQMVPQVLRISGNGSSFTLRGVRPLLNAQMEFSTAAVRELYVDLFCFKCSVATLHKRIKVLPALEILAFSRTRFPVGLLSALIEEPVLCPALKTIAFLDCNIDSDVIKQLEEAIAKRGDSTVARVCRVVIVNSARRILDRTLIQQLQKSVPCVEIRMDDGWMTSSQVYRSLWFFNVGRVVRGYLHNFIRIIGIR